jgi:hypothetical protein
MSKKTNTQDTPMFEKKTLHLTRGFGFLKKNPKPYPKAFPKKLIRRINLKGFPQKTNIIGF